MEDFSKVFTIEMLGPKGWEVIGTFISLTLAVNAYRKCLLRDYEAYRLTSPTDKSIYE